MLQDKLPQLLHSSTLCLKVLVSASYKAKQSLAAKGLSPAMFLDSYYRQLPGNTSQSLNEISYNFKQKQIKPLPPYISIDLDDYAYARKEGSKDPTDDIDEEMLGRKIYQMLCEQKIKYVRNKTMKDLSPGRIQKFINDQGFYWFQKATKLFYYGASMGQENFRVNTSDQPVGICYIIEVQKNKTAKQCFQKIKNDTDFLLRRMFELNPDQISNVRQMLIILFDVSQGCTIQQALQYTGYFKQNTSIHASLIYRLPINVPQQQCYASIEHTHFSRPLLSFKARPSSAPVYIISNDDHKKLQEIIQHHKESIRRYIEIRIEQLFRKYQEITKPTKVIANFFRSSTPSDFTYTKEEVQIRQLADWLLLIQDYKRAYDIYKWVAGKMEKRNPAIQINLNFAMQICIAMSKFHNIKIRSDAYGEIQKNSEKVLSHYQSKGKTRLRAYLIFLVLIFHTYKVFNRDFIRNKFYYAIKQTFYQVPTSSSPASLHYLNTIPTLIYEQFAYTSLLTPVPQPRRFAYDLTRVASRLTQIRLYPYSLRCYLLIEGLYKDTFSNIEKYQAMQMSHLMMEVKDYNHSVTKLREAWKVYVDRMESEDTTKNQMELQKMVQNYQRIIKQIQKVGPESLLQPSQTLQIPLILSLTIQTKDEFLEYDQKSGIKWYQIGQSILESKQFMSAGLNQKQFKRMFASFDTGVPEQKYLIYGWKDSAQGNISDAVIKKNSRNAYVGQPIRITLYMRNPLRSDIDVEHVKVLLSQPNANFNISPNPYPTVSIKPFKSTALSFTIIPNQSFFMSLYALQWHFQKLLCQYKIPHPNTTVSSYKSSYFHLNILQKTGCLQACSFFQDYYYQGQSTTVKIKIKNVGTEIVKKVYVGVGNEAMFGWKLKEMPIQVGVGQEKDISLKITIPLVHDSIQSGQEKNICKMLIIYKSGDRFRVTRTINKFNILRIAKIYNIVCQRLSTHLHLLSFSKKKNNKQEANALQWMIIPGGFDIVKKQAADLASQTNYFFFLRKGNYSLTKFQFQSWALSPSAYPQQFFTFPSSTTSSGSSQTLSLHFLWHKQQKLGYIPKYGIPISLNEHGYLSTVFPINFKINYPRQIIHDFFTEPFLSVPISIKLKNVIYKDQLKVKMYFVQDSGAGNGANLTDASWQGITERNVHLAIGQQAVVDINYVVVRPGVYILSNYIKYSITNSKNEHVNITHSQYQKIYLTVKSSPQANRSVSPSNVKSPTSTIINMDFQDAFKQFQIQRSTQPSTTINTNKDPLNIMDLETQKKYRNQDKEIERSTDLESNLKTMEFRVEPDSLI